MVKRDSYKKGFTLVEVIVVAAIVGMVAATVIPNFGKMNSRFAADLLAHDIALAIRGAQADALNGRTFAGGPKSAYGIAVTSVAGDDGKIVEFQDTNDSGAYEQGTDGLVETSEFQNRTRIHRVCRKRAGESMVCDAISRLDIVFVRPNPDALMEGDGGAGGTEQGYAEAGILLLSSDGELEKCVHIYSTGQVSVTNGAGNGTVCP